MNPQLLLFTDVDGCLVNKHDYSYEDALPALDRLKRLLVPIILCSSKTAGELTSLSEELQLEDSPLICENGARILWRGQAFGEERSTVCGVPRTTALEVLSRLKPEFRFRSFVDLELEGVMAATDLPRDQAVLAMDRQGTEPLMWDDDLSRIDVFRQALAEEDLTLTRGGRFWHVAGGATKGEAMREVTAQFKRSAGRAVETVAIGDSPIDQSMLKEADWPIGIPDPDGSHAVTVSENGLYATVPGAAGWAESIGHLLDRVESAS